LNTGDKVIYRTRSITLRKKGREILQEQIDWYRGFLAKRGLERSNGKMLFRYRTTAVEYLSLRELLCRRLTALGGLPWKFTSSAECALFVLYSAEWWRREYTGGAWRWTRIIESLTTGSYNIDAYERTDAVERGLRVWGHRPSLDGKKYLGAIVAQGGLPLQMIAQGDGAVTKLLVRGMRHAQLLGWDEDRLEQYFATHEMDLVQHLRAAEIFRLLASVVSTVLELRSEFRLAGANNPLEILDKVQPTWRDRFPIAADDRSAEPLLTGLVKEAARVIKAVNAYPVSISRTLVRRTERQDYELVMSIQLATNITLEALAAALGVSSKSLPQSFTLELEGGNRTTLGTGRQLLGGQESTVMLSGKPRRFTNDDAKGEVLMVLRGLGSDLHAPAAIPGGDGLEDSQPWVFANRDAELALVAVGSCNIPDDACFVAVPESFSVEPCQEGHVNLVGSISGLSQVRRVYEVQGTAIVSDAGETYQVRTSQSQDESVQLVWKGSRLAYRTTPFPVYQGVPSLYRIDSEGMLHPVAPRDIDWVSPEKCGDIVAAHRLHQGPIDAWVKSNGVRQRRFRMALIPANAKVRFTSGSTENSGEIEFQGWGLHELHTTQDLQLSAEINSSAAKLIVESALHPPATFVAAMTWPNARQLLQIELPFPSTGGRFSTLSGEILANQATHPLRRLEDIRLQVYDRNPDSPKRYALQIELQGNTQSRTKNHHRVSVAVPLNSQGFGEIRLFEIESNLYDLLCQSDSLDAKLTLNLCVGQSPIRKLNLTRYDLPLERESDSFSLSSEAIESASLETRLGMKLRAVPLLESQGEDVEIGQILSEGAPTGRWNAGQLARQHAPWLLYPAEDSTLQIRPTAFAMTRFDGLSILAADACPLSIAMTATTQQDRDRTIRSVVVDMSTDFEHMSWKLVLHQHRILGHLPLATMDYWRAFGQSHQASIAVVLKLVSNIPALMQRMRHELGVIWELTPNKVLSVALGSLSASLSKQLAVESGSEMHKSIVCDLFRKLGLGSNALATQIDLALYQGGFGMGTHFNNLVEASKKKPRAVLQSQWMGEDSMLQRILLRAHSEDREWPQFGLIKALVEALMEQCDEQVKEYLMEFGRDLIWLPASAPTGPVRKNEKDDVANAPFLTALLVQLTGSSEWLHATGRMAQLRQIRAFDPDWFEIAIQAGGLLAALKSAHVAQNPNFRRAQRP
jgi:hypothetical protein